MILAINANYLPPNITELQTGIFNCWLGTEFIQTNYMLQRTKLSIVKSKNIKFQVQIVEITTTIITTNKRNIS